ncbi:MFS transporter [Arthrobacter sp. S2(2024)]|uniref:MFS transporter n=1 Tax=Arthrobacter sp. S2(2024) TaxID=3111911 RepID=UPI002FCC606E
MSTKEKLPALKLEGQERKAFLSAFIGWLFDYYEIFILTFLLIPIAKEWGLSATQSAWVVSASLLSLAIGGVLFGGLADKIGRRKVLIVTLLVYSLATLARGLAPNYETLLILTVVAGLGLGGEYGVGQSLVTETLKAGRRGWWSGVLYGGAFVAIMVAALVGGYLLPAVGWRWTFVISGLPALFAFYLRSNAPESEAWEKSKRSAPRRSISEFTKASFIKPFMLCLVAASLYFWAYYGVTTLLPKYLVSSGFSMSQASWWIFFTAFAGLLGCLTSAWASDHIGRRLSLSILMGLAALGGLILYLAGETLLTSAWILVPFFIMYFGSNAATIFASMFSEVFPTRVRSTGLSASLQIARASSAAPPLIASGLIATQGYSIVFMGGAALYGAVALWAWLFPETRGLELHTLDKIAEGREPALDPDGALR